MGWPFRNKKDKSDQNTNSTPSNNPYAQDTASNQYAYNAKPAHESGSMSGPPPAYNDNNNRTVTGGQRSNAFDSQLRDEKSPVPPGGYGGVGNNRSYGRSSNDQGYGGGGDSQGYGSGSDSQGYGGGRNNQGYGGSGNNQGYGGSGNNQGYGGSYGYGGGRYAASSDSSSSPYGNSGPRTNVNNRNTQQHEDPRKDQLFGKAAQRHAQEQQQRSDNQRGNTYGGRNYQIASSHDRDQLLGGAQARRQEGRASHSNYATDNYSGNATANHDMAGNMEPMTEEEAIAQTRAETKQLRVDGIHSLDRSLLALQQATEAGQHALDSVKTQNDSLIHSEQLLYDSHQRGEQARDTIKTIDRVAGSMFVYAGTSKRERELAAGEATKKHIAQKNQREANRAERYENKHSTTNAPRNLSSSDMGLMKGTASNSKYRFDEDDEDEGRDEHDINERLKAMSTGLHGAKGLAQNLNTNLEYSNQLIGRVVAKADDVDLTLQKGTDHLNRRYK